MRSSDYTPGGKPLTGRKVLAIAVAFFLIVLGVNGAMMYSAISTFPGLVVKNSYVESQRFNQILADDKAQQAMGWRPELDYAQGAARLRMTGPDGAPLDGLTISGRIERPTDAKGEQALDFAPRGAGLYEAPVALAAGQWLIEAQAVDGSGRTYRISKRLIVKQEHAL